METRIHSLAFPMEYFMFAIVSSTFAFVLCARGCSSTNVPPGHLQPFGCCNPVKGGMPTVEGWPHPVDFFEEYIIPQRPLLLKNAGKLSPAYRLWSDEYFLNMDLPPDAMIKVETGKKEERNGSGERMSFKDWVRRYNTTDQYMVQDMPGYLGKDVILPPSLQCSSFVDNALLAEGIVWFSSGGTKSVVHTDEFHNLNCLFAGTKHFIVVDPNLYGKKVPLNNAGGTFSTLDVDRVDLKRYPSLAEVEYYNATMEAGDCIFLPTLWIHQVNSYNRNIAVNLWFRADAGERTDLSTCSDEFDPSLTMDKIRKQGLVSDLEILDAIREMLFGFTGKFGNISYAEFNTGILMDHYGYLSKETDLGFMDPLEKMFLSLDHNADDMITEDECKEATAEDWKTFAERFHDLRVILRARFEDRPDVFNNFFEYPDEMAEESLRILDQEEKRSDVTAESGEQVGQGGAGEGKDGEAYFKEEL